MAKKKKPASNPARGFATTSIASKPKPEKQVEAPSSSQPTSKEIEPLNPEQVVAPPTQPGEDAKEQVRLTPEEYEAQLEQDELQLLVEKHASKTRREARRQVSKVETDRRVLRSSAEFLSVHDWLPDDLLERILSLAKAESNDSNRRIGQQAFLKGLSEEEATARLWTLDLMLKQLGFSDAQSEFGLRWLCANAANVDASANVWGLQEALELLSLEEPSGQSFSYDAPQAAPSVPQSRSSSRPVTPSQLSLDQSPLRSQNESADESTGSEAHHARAHSGRDVREIDDSDIGISDLDSDLEPDELVPTYLRIKGRIYAIEPEALDITPSKSKGSKKKSLQPAVAKSASARKLLSQLQQIESDALFDRDQAEALWPATRNQIAQETASKLKSQVSSAIASPQMPASPIPPPMEPDDEHGRSIEADGSDGSMLGDMFEAIPDDGAAANNDGAPAESGKVRLQDFGKQAGLTPRRILEETIRSRDPKAKVIYKLVSPTTYSCRHSVTIIWTKPQDLDYEQNIPDVAVDIQPQSAQYTALQVAAVSAQQSEGYISTIALFSSFSNSSKEEKSYLRLPTVWRELYKELLEQQKERVDAADREAIKRFRTIIQDQVEQEEADGVVLTNRLKQRNQANPGASSGDMSRNTPPTGLDSLKELWSQKSSTPSFLQMSQIRSTLPVSAYRSSILSVIEKNQVTIICGETGCGKSTQIPSFILEHELSKGMPCKIFCTEPRRISAISLAQRVSEELGEAPRDLGTLRSLVGYAIRLESKTSAQTRLVFATVGVVLRMLESSQRLEGVTHLIIDEVHERNIDTDFFLIILRSLMLVRPELKVILMSATVDAQKFSNYLNNAPIMNIPGRTFPVETRFLEDAIEFTHYNTATEERFDDSETSEEEELGTEKDRSGIPSKLPGYSAATRTALQSYDEYRIDYDLIVSLIERVAYDPQHSSYSKAILVFLPGIAEIRQLNDMLTAHPSFGNDWLIYPLHSTIASEDQQAAFHIPPPGMRKIVLATNIAETGVTIPDITCVIDTGKHKEMRFDERRQLSRLTQSFIARANAKQRRGRAGRVQEGLCFHLFTKHRFETLMAEQQTPEMLRLSLQDLVMRTKICKLGDIEQTLSEALDPPSSKNIRRAIDALIEVDALTPSEELTHLGRQLAKLPLDAHLGKLVLLAGVFNTVDVALTIAAILSSKSPFLTPFGAKQRADIARLAFKKGDSDLLTAYNAYKAWKAVCTKPGVSEARFCHTNFLSAQNLANIEDLKAQLLSSLVEVGFIQLSPEERKALTRYRSTSRYRNFVSIPPQYDTHSDNDALVTSVIAAAFYPKILTRDGKGWRNVANNQSVSLAPTSVNKGTRTAQYLSYYSIMQSSSKFYNAHSTSVAHALPLTLLVGSAAADVDFKLHCGVVSLPGNVLRFGVRDWRVCTALKVLRRRVREILTSTWRNPRRVMGLREREWMGLFVRVFEEKEGRERRRREGEGRLGK